LATGGAPKLLVRLTTAAHPHRGAVGDLPEKHGKWMTVYQRFRRWSEAGIREAVATTLAQAMADKKAIASCLFTFVYFRASTRRRFLLQFDLIVINSGTDEIF
jgi:transposase